MKNRMLIKKMLYMVSLASMSVVLSLIEIPWFPIPPVGAFLKLDFSEVIILFSILILGYKDTFVVILIRTIGRRFFRGFGIDGWIGEFLAVNASLAIMLAHYTAIKILRKAAKPLIVEVPAFEENVSIKNIFVMTTSITLFLTIILTTVNFFIGTPMYFGLFLTGTPIFNPFELVSVYPDFANIYDYLVFCLISYVPFNLVKGIVIGLVYSLLQPRMKYLEI